MLSAKELFKYRNGLDQVIPQRGGTKDFMPDGSWLQNKQLEKFNDERERVLDEPRVMREIDLARGEWDPDRKLVGVRREMKNFWEHMGFVDKERKWLYPEEALFLMETVVLEIWYNGLPLSISECYMLMLDDFVTLEYYQVYAHFRRIGFVVLRHQGRLDYTKYERQIGLDKMYLSRRERRAMTKMKQTDGEKKKKLSYNHSLLYFRLDYTKYERQIGLDKMYLSRRERRAMKKMKQTDGEDKDSEDKADSPSTEMTSNQVSQEMDVDSQKTVLFVEVEGKNSKATEKSSIEKSTFLKALSTEISCDEKVIEGKIENEIDMEAGCSKQDNAVDENSITVVQDETKMEVSNDETDTKVDSLDETKNETTSKTHKDTIRFKEYTNKIEEVKGDYSKGSNDFTDSNRKKAEWNFNEIVFPDFGTEETVIKICQPNKGQTPGNLETVNQTYEYDRVNNINKKKDKRRSRKEEEMNEKLKFSCPSMREEFAKNIKSCKNWQEYKSEKARQRQLWKGRDEFPHLFKEVEPLVKPELATSTATVLEQLQIIKEVPKDDKRDEDKPDLLPHFDVYKPDTKFIKSRPGMPHHRVVVAKCSDPMPELSTVVSITSYLHDDVPLKWAVVETGNIALYDVSEFSLPLDIPFG